MFNDFYRHKKVLVTGHTGFKGAWLTQWLLHLGANVAGYSDRIPTEPNHFQALGLENKIKHFIGDVRDFPTFQKAIKEFEPEVIFHLAAQALVFESYQNPLTTLQTNILGTANVLEAIRYAPSVKVAVMVTSDKCYENVEWEFGYRETDRLGGKDIYSASKACAEVLFHSYQKSFFQMENNCKLATARAGNVIGGGDWAKDRLVPDCIRAWAAGKKATIRNPKSIRPWQHVLEPLSGYLSLGTQLFNQKENVAGEGFNFGPTLEKKFTVLEVIEEMRSVWSDGEYEIIKPPVDKKEAGTLFLNCDRANERLGWLPTLYFSETVEMTGKWYQAFYKKAGSVEELTLNQIKYYETMAVERKRKWAI